MTVTSQALKGAFTESLAAAGLSLTSLGTFCSVEDGLIGPASNSHMKGRERERRRKKERKEGRKKRKSCAKPAFNINAS